MFVSCLAYLQVSAAGVSIIFSLAAVYSMHILKMIAFHDGDDVSTYSLGRSLSFALILISSLILGRVGNINVKYLLMFNSLLDESLDDLVLLVTVDSFGLHKLRNWRQLFTRSRHSPILFQRKNFRGEMIRN